ALDDAASRFSGRAHGVDEASGALAIAQRHFARVSIDLIYARPDQSSTAWEGESARALAFGTEHSSLYHSTMEPNTVFAKFPPEHSPDDATSAAMQDAVEPEPAAAGSASHHV
ncbi:hypothetical protein OY671_012237, partial [Metschnikowia pulcherrima]